jgi:hypothetical protein
MDVRDSGNADEHDPSDSQRADQAPEPRKARLSGIVEAIALLCIVLGLLAVLVLKFGGDAAPAWVANSAILLIGGGLSSEGLVGGILLIVAPRMMAGTGIERRWLASAARHWVAGLLLICSSVCLAILTIAFWAVNAGVFSVQAPTWSLVVLLVGAFVPPLVRPIGQPLKPLLRGRRNGTTRRRPRD